MNKEQLVQSLSNIWNDRNLDHVDQLFSQDVILHSPLGSFQGAKEMRHLVEKWTAVLSELKTEFLEVFQEGQAYIVTWRARGIHQGDFDGIKAEGRPISYIGCTLFKFENEKVVFYQSYVDRSHIERQMLSSEDTMS